VSDHAGMAVAAPRLPILARTKRGMAAARATMPAPVVLVPTMGALHDGHRVPLRKAREVAGPTGSVLVSIFVNPLQFGPNEDFDRYPRPLQHDMGVCAEEGAAVVFAPDRAQMYPTEPLVTVDPGPAGRVLEGRSRPGFFEGVLTVVLKLFQLTSADAAVFGAKDAQQLALIRRMVVDLNLDVEIVAAPLHRDADGLASSSRNSYLSPAERAAALALPRALTVGAQAAGRGTEAVLAAACQVLDDAANSSPPVLLDYLVLADPDTFTDVKPDHAGPAILLVAAKVGQTRLIDNAAMDIGIQAEAANEPDAACGPAQRPDGDLAGGTR